MKHIVTSGTILFLSLFLLFANNYCDNLKRNTTETKITTKSDGKNGETTKWSTIKEIKLSDNHPCLMFDLQPENELLLNRLVIFAFIYFVSAVTGSIVVDIYKGTDKIKNLVNNLLKSENKEKEE